MVTAAARARQDGGRARATLRAHLEARRGEIEAAALTRVRAISDSGEVSDPDYAEGLRAAVAAAVDYGIETTGREGGDPPIPVPLLAQARMAARVGIPLDTVLRRYFAGYSLLGYFILEEAAHAGLTDGAELQRLLGDHAGIFDRLLATVGEEYAREADDSRGAKGRQLAERIERLLSGEMLDTSSISYDFEGWHLGIVASGSGAKQRLRDLARGLDLRLLLIDMADRDKLWAWLGVRRKPDPAAVVGNLARNSRDDTLLAVGEPGRGLSGWRITHNQALAALAVGRRAGREVVRYADVALPAALLRDDTLVTSLRQLYLLPLERDRDGGAAMKETLRAYLAAGCNISSAAAALEIRRQTVSSRLRSCEERLGLYLNEHLAGMSAALQVEELCQGNVGADGELQRTD